MFINALFSCNLKEVTILNNPDSMVVIDQQAPHKLRGGMAGMIAIALLLTISVGGTYAYITWSGNQTPNRFTNEEFLTCDLIEPAWTNAALTDYGLSEDATSADTVGTDVTVYYSGEGENIAIPKAATYQAPGSFFKKNPFIINTSTYNGDVTRPADNPTGYGYAAMKIQFQKMGADGTYTNMTKDDVKALFNCYYIGNVEGTGDAQIPNAETAAGWGGSDHSNLGANWVQLTSAQGFGENGVNEASNAGAMYFMYKTPLAPLGETVNNETTGGAARDAISPKLGEIKEVANSDTWGYTTGSSYATTPLFQGVRYADATTQANIDALKKVLDPEGAVTNNGHVASWRMVITSAIISVNETSSESSPFNPDGSLISDSYYMTSFKEMFATETTRTQATGIRNNKSTLGAHIELDGSTAKVVDGKGISENLD